MPPGRDGPEKDPKPLEPDREGGLIEGLPALAAQLREAGGQLQAAELGLGLLDPAQSRGGRDSGVSHRPERGSETTSGGPDQPVAGLLESELAPMRATPPGSGIQKWAD